MNLGFNDRVSFESSGGLGWGDVSKTSGRDRSEPSTRGEEQSSINRKHSVPEIELGHHATKGKKGKRGTGNAHRCFPVPPLTLFPSS